MTFKLYKLKATVANEHHDGRRRYGLASIKEFEVGTTYSLQESEAIPGEERARHPAVVVYQGTSSTISRDVELLLLSVSAEVPMVSWSDVRKVVNPGSDSGWLSDAVLEALLIRGLVDVTTLHQFAADIYNSPE